MIKVVVATQPQKFPAGTVAGSFRYTLASDAGYSSQQLAEGVEADFSDATAPGNYTATVERLDASGNVLGSPATGTVTIAEPSPVNTDVEVDVPATITVSLA